MTSALLAASSAASYICLPSTTEINESTNGLGKAEGPLISTTRAFWAQAARASI